MIESKDIIAKRHDGSQVVEYNNPFFPCFASNPYFAADKTFYATEHWHEDLEYLYVLDGELEYSVNGENIILHSGEGILVNSKRIHSNRSVPGVHCAFYCAITHPSLLCPSKYMEQTYLNPLIDSHSFDYLLLKNDDWTVSIIEELKRLFDYRDPKTVELEIFEASVRICKIIYKHMQINSPTTEAPSFNVGTFKTMMIFIQDHYMEKISLVDIARAGNVGKTLCAKLFKKYVSKTPGEYLIFYRIQKSIELLTDTNMSTTEISYATGFSSASHYTKTFRELMGCTPLKYRKGNPKYEYEYCLIPTAR